MGWDGIIRLVKCGFRALVKVDGCMYVCMTCLALVVRSSCMPFVYHHVDKRHEKVTQV